MTTITIAGQQYTLISEGPTSKGKSPTYVSCDPNNWGMRRYDPASGKKKADYPIVRAYVNAVKPLLMEQDWRDITWPPADPKKNELVQVLTAQLQKALGTGAFGLPVDAMPKILFPDDAQLDKHGIVNAAGTLIATTWQLLIAPRGITSIISAAKSGGISGISKAAKELAGTLYHEARHAQQNFWMAALLQQYPNDYKHLPNIQYMWPHSEQAKYWTIAAKTPLPNEPTAHVSLYRMLIGTYYWVLYGYNNDLAQAKQNLSPSEYDQWAKAVSNDLPLARKAAYDFLEGQQTGAGGTPIDVDRMVEKDSSHSDYSSRPWEGDSYACEDVVHRIWDGGAHADLPQSGFCTKDFSSIVRAAKIPREGERDAH